MLEVPTKEQEQIALMGEKVTITSVLCKTYRRNTPFGDFRAEWKTFWVEPQYWRAGWVVGFSSIRDYLVTTVDIIDGEYSAGTVNECKSLRNPNFKGTVFKVCLHPKVTHILVPAEGITLGWLGLPEGCLPKRETMTTTLMKQAKSKLE